jgi:hypothetical protein
MNNPTVSPSQASAEVGISLEKNSGSHAGANCVSSPVNGINNPDAALAPMQCIETGPQPEQSQTPEAHFGLGTGVWYALEEAVVGLAHRSKNLPCQDAAQAASLPRTALVLADGAGSSAVSELGAQAVVKGTVRLLDTLDKSLGELLDGAVTPPLPTARSMGLLLVKHAMGLLSDLANLHRREIRDFRCTFLVVVVGQQRLLWVKVGDGALVIEKMRQGKSEDATILWESACSTLGEIGKGEFANVTQFLDSITPADVQCGLLNATDISGVAAMSDGAGEKLVSNDGRTVANRISVLLDKLRQGRLRRTELTKMFYEEGFCRGTTGDDRSIALAARTVSLPPALPARDEAISVSPKKHNGKPKSGTLTLGPRSNRKVKHRR